MDRLWETVAYFFNSQALSPHGICLLWRPELVWTHAVSDVLIGLAYFSIPLALGVFLYHRRDVTFSWAVWMFVAFIMLCGVTHWMMVWTLWTPIYGVEALVKAATAGVSVVTAMALWPLLPKVIALPSPALLQARIDERDQALADLRRAMADMVEMQEHEQRQRLLLDELNHRVKNNLATVQSIAAQTLARSGSMEEFRDTFMDRLMSLSSTHNLLVERRWEGASFRQMVERTLGHFGRPYSYDGPDLTLSPNYAVTLGMALHELATNALKHGAWSREGRIEIETAVTEDGAAAKIVWRERGGPRVRKPDSQGFGSRLLERGVARELGGEVKVVYPAAGLTCTITVPISAKAQPIAA